LFLVPKMGHEPAGVQLLQIGLGIGGALIAFCCCCCFCKWFCADDEKSGKAVSEAQPQPLEDGGGLYNPQQHPGFELQQASSGFQVQPSTFSAPQQEQAPGFQSLPQAGNVYQTQQQEGFQAPMGSFQPQPTGYPVYPPPEHHMMEPHFNPPPPPPYPGPPQGVLPTNNQLQQSSAGFQAPSLHPQPSTYYPSSEQQAKKTTSPVKKNPNSASSNQVHSHIYSNQEPSSIKERESFPVKQKEKASLAMLTPPNPYVMLAPSDPNAWQAPSDPYARQPPYSPYPRY